MGVPYESLLPDLVNILHAEGVDEDSFNKARGLYNIKSAYREFIRDTDCLRRIINIPSQANVSEYRLFKVDGHVIGKLYSVSVQVDCEQWVCYKKGKICSCRCCHNEFGYQEGFLSICPPPRCDGMSIELCVSVYPDSAACEMDEFVYEHYYDYIAAGAASKLLASRKKTEYSLRYTYGKEKAAIDAAKQWGRLELVGGGNVWYRR